MTKKTWSVTKKLLQLPIFCKAVVDYRHSGTNLFSQHSGYSNSMENYVLSQAKSLMKVSWETETSTEIRKAVNPLVISPEDASRGENDSDG
jgi:hypothetical protein